MTRAVFSAMNTLLEGPRREFVRPNFAARCLRKLRALDSLRGWRRLVNWLVPEHHAPFVVVNPGVVVNPSVVVNRSVRYHGNLGSHIDRQVYLFGGYESASIARFIALVPPERRGVILDIGANAGTHSQQFARAFYQVHAFEPNPQLWTQFETNMTANATTNVLLHKVGLADRDADLMMQIIDKANLGLGTFSTHDQYDLPLQPLVACPVRHASEYLLEQSVSRIDAIKIDVQGFEPEVLRGLNTVLRRDRPIVWCEIGAGTASVIGHKDDLARFVPFPFHCLRFEPGAGILHRIQMKEYRDELPHGDYALVPQQSR